MNITIRKISDVNGTSDAAQALEIARASPEFFDANGLKQIEDDTKKHILYGAFSCEIPGDGTSEKMIGFVTYKPLDAGLGSRAIEMTWLAVSPEYRGKGVGAKLVEESLADISAMSLYTSCEVKTLAETDPYEPYEQTRAFYKKLGFETKEIIDPYPAWGDNPCQVFARKLRP